MRLIDLENHISDIIWLLAAKEGRPLAVCSWAMMIEEDKFHENGFDEIAII